MKQFATMIIFSAFVFLCAGVPRAAAEVSKELIGKKDITNLDWGVLRAQIDIENGIALHNSNPELDKWKLNPALRFIKTDKKLVIVSYDIPNKAFSIFSTSEKENQLEKIIVFTIEKVQNYLPELERKDFVIEFYRSGERVGTLENNRLQLTGTTMGSMSSNGY